MGKTQKLSCQVPKSKFQIFTTQSNSRYSYATISVTSTGVINLNDGAKMFDLPQIAYLPTKSHRSDAIISLVF